MEEKEVIERIISEHKFYVGVMPQSSASLFIKRYREGKLRHKTIVEFMKKFGYVLSDPAKYKKI